MPAPKITIYVILLISSLFLTPGLQYAMAQASGDFQSIHNSSSTSSSSLSNFKKSTSTAANNDASTVNNTSLPEAKEVKIGALLPLSGAVASEGQTEQVALNIAAKQINENLSKTNSNISRINLIAEDTKTDPANALQKLKDLASKG